MKALRIAGVDEAGRGPLAGPVSVAAVILDPNNVIHGLDDSKKLSPKHRLDLFEKIRTQALSWHIVHIDVATIDEINILQATLLGMQEAVAGLNPQPQRVLIDGNRCPPLKMPAKAIIGGDASEAAISAASILAKQSRDQYMCTQDQQWPEYGFKQHKGYPTPQHKAALKKYGPCPIHRLTFAPVREVLLKPSLNK